jgi:hypothetical protein
MHRLSLPWLVWRIPARGCGTDQDLAEAMDSSGRDLAMTALSWIPIGLAVLAIGLALTSLALGRKARRLTDEAQRIMQASREVR